MYKGLVILALLLPVFATAQKTSKRLYVVSLVAFNAVNVLDVTSSYGKRELNPAFSGANRTFDVGSVGVKVGALVAVNMFEALLLRRHPERMRTAAIANLLMTGILGGMVIHNFGASPPP